MQIQILKLRLKKELGEILVIRIFKIIILLFVAGCSLNSSSSLWTKHKKIEYDKSLVSREINSEKEILNKEINPNIKIKINYEKNKINNSNIKTNNNGFTKYDGQLKKISKYRYSKIQYFNQYDPEISLYENNLIFFDNKGTILNFQENSKLLWKKNYYSKIERKKNPILFFSNKKNILIVADTLARYYSIDLKSGDIIWSKNNDAPFNSQIKILDNKFFVVDDNNILSCFSLKSGEKLWSYKTEKTLIKSKKKISIIIKDNKVFFANSLGDITAIDSNSGKLLWQTPTQSKSVYEDAMFLKISDLVLANNSIIFSNNMNEFFSLDETTGIINWKQLVNSSLRPTRVNDFIFTVSEEGFLIIIDFKTGSIIRSTDLFKNLKKKVRKKTKPTGFIVGKKNLYLTTSTGRLFIAGIDNGQTISIIKLDSGKILRPVVLKESLFIAKNDSIIKLN